MIDLATRRVVATVSVGERPYAVALAQGRAFITDQYGGAVSVFDVASLAKLGRIKVGDHPEGIAQAETAAGCTSPIGSPTLSTRSTRRP